MKSVSEDGNEGKGARGFQWQGTTYVQNKAQGTFGVREGLVYGQRFFAPRGCPCARSTKAAHVGFASAVYRWAGLFAGRFRIALSIDGCGGTQELRDLYLN